MLVAPFFASCVLAHARARAVPFDLFVDAAAPCSQSDGSQAAPFCTLAEALSVAVPGEVIRIAAGTYPENVVVSADVHLVGTDGAGTTILDGSRLTTVMKVLAGASVVIDGLTITNGFGESGGIRNDGSLLLRNSTVSSNEANGLQVGAGGIYHTHQAGDLTLRNCTISENRCLSFINIGGGVLAYGTGVVTIKDSLFYRNRCVRGSAFSISSPSVRIDGTTITKNYSVGGGLGFLQSGDATITNTTIAKNRASGFRIAPLAGNPTRLDHCTIYDNDTPMYPFQEYRAGLTVESLLGNVILSNTVVAGANHYAYYGDILGSPLSGGNNLIGEVVGSNAQAFQDGLNGDLVGRSPIGVDANLGRVRDNGGLTPTSRPRRGSPLIGAGAVAPAMGKDQRGLPWPAGPSDIGAVRYNFDRTPIDCIPEANSSGFPGELFATGSQKAVDNGLELTLTSLPPHQLAVVLMGPSVGITPFPAGSDGILCLAAPVRRLLGPGQVLTADASGIASLAVDFRSLPQGPGPALEVHAGTTLVFQAWHRDSIQGTPTSNFTAAARVDFR